MGCHLALLRNASRISEPNLLLFRYLRFRTFVNFVGESSVQVAVKLNSKSVTLNPIGATYDSDYNIPRKAGNEGSP
ncbi:hypothetical protein BH20ACI3_BH20ACI3_21020 [soil metagenome]